MPGPGQQFEAGAGDAPDEQVGVGDRVEHVLVAVQDEGGRGDVDQRVPGELTTWTHVRHWGPRSLADMHRFIDGLVVLTYSRKVATRWGELQATLRGGLGRPTTVGSRLAASSGLPLATLNTKDFADFAEHEGLDLVG